MNSNQNVRAMQTIVLDSSQTFFQEMTNCRYGLSVFVEEMELGSCEEDFVQFGRDILFVTTHLSRYCCNYLECC